MGCPAARDPLPWIARDRRRRSRRGRRALIGLVCPPVLAGATVTRREVALRQKDRSQRNPVRRAILGASPSRYYAASAVRAHLHVRTE